MTLSEAVNSRSKTTNNYRGALQPLKDFCAYVYMKGQSIYEALYLNSTIPSKNTIKTEIVNEQKMRIGKIYIEPLFEYLREQNINCEKFIIQEDATRLLSRIDYDIETNELMGLLPEYNLLNGLPKFNFFAVTTPSKTLHFLKNFKKAPYLQLIVCKPQVLGMFLYIN